MLTRGRLLGMVTYDMHGSAQLGRTLCGGLVRGASWLCSHCPSWVGALRSKHLACRQAWP